MQPAAAEQFFRRFGVLVISHGVRTLDAEFTFLSVCHGIHILIQQRPDRTFRRDPHRSCIIRLRHLKGADGSHGLTHAVVIPELVAVPAALTREALASRHDHLQCVGFASEIRQHRRTDEGHHDLMLRIIIL